MDRIPFILPTGIAAYNIHGNEENNIGPPEMKVMTTGHARPMLTSPLRRGFTRAMALNTYIFT
jgi:hypothetical protein